jgi:hypothetical protein
MLQEPNYITATGGTINLWRFQNSYIYSRWMFFSYCAGLPAGSTIVDYLVVAGGGGGGNVIQVEVEQVVIENLRNSVPGQLHQSFSKSNSLPASVQAYPITVGWRWSCSNSSLQLEMDQIQYFQQSHQQVEVVGGANVLARPS